MSESFVRDKDNYLIFGAPAIEEQEIEEVVRTIRSGWLGTGPRVAKFEENFARYKDVEYAAAVNSCTAAMHLSLIAGGIGPGDEVITTPMTFCSTVNTILHAGATPVLADVDPVSMNIDPLEVERRITPHTRGLMPVHMAGRACDMDPLLRIAEEHDLVVIEDCAHAVETEYHGRPAGTLGHFGCFSFYVNKNVVTGEGGMVLAKREEDHQAIKMLALHGMSRDAWKRFGSEGYKHYQVVAAGYKYNMMDIQAALGIHQLARVEANWQRRREIWRAYDDAFVDLPITTPAPPEPDTRHGYHLYTLLVDEEETGISRDAFLAEMKAHGIGVGVHYLSIPEHPFYQETFGWQPEDWPNAMLIGRQTVSIPLSPKLTDRDVGDVITAVRSVIGNAKG